MSRKIALQAAAFVGAALLTSSLSFAQQPPTPPAVRALEALPAPAATLGTTKTYSAGPCKRHARAGSFGR